MCGLAGFTTKNLKGYNPEKILEKMCGSLFHRGPDSSGKLVLRNKEVAFAHTRLAIMDLSNAGNQPFFDGKNVLVFNGEIYNHNAIREEIEKLFGPQSWAGHSDTETLFQAFVKMGVSWTLEKIRGMFALAFYSGDENAMYLCRDIAGEKPLYFSLTDGDLIFGSELKALKQHPCFSNEINPHAVETFLQFGYTGRSQSIYRSVNKLPGASYLRFDCKTRELKIYRYWSLDAHRDGALSRLPIKQHLINAIDRQLLADVEVGCFLSGGVDSSLISVLSALELGKKLQTFSVGFEHTSHDESEYANFVAERIKSKHHAIVCTANDAQNFVQKMSDVYDEPFGDSSQIPTYLVSKLASKHLKVCLSGDGADELFGGYSRYYRSLNIWRYKQALPKPMRLFASKVINRVPSNCYNIGNLLMGREINVRDKALKFSKILAEEDYGRFYNNFLTYWKIEEILLGPHTSRQDDTRVYPALDEMQRLDFHNYLQEDILVKIDRSAMANSLETRAPFLDKEVICAAFELDVTERHRGANGKVVLKDILSEYLPIDFVNRKKMGFGVPMEHWLRNDLKAWGEDIINCRLPEELGINESAIKIKWDEHQAGKRNWQNLLWSMLVFKNWYMANHA